MLTRGPHVLAIPGTTSLAHLQENLGAAEVQLSADIMARLEALINQNTVTAARYSAANQLEVDTEEF